MQYRKASDILTSTLAAFFYSSHPKRERDRQAHLNYYTSADNRENCSHGCNHYTQQSYTTQHTTVLIIFLLETFGQYHSLDYVY